MVLVHVNYNVIDIMTFLLQCFTFPAVNSPVQLPTPTSTCASSPAFASSTPSFAERTPPPPRRSASSAKHMEDKGAEEERRIWKAHRPARAHWRERGESVERRCEY